MKKFILAIIVSGIIISLCGCEKSDYNTAIKHMEAGKFEQAMELFEQLEQKGGYKDSAQKYLECRYKFVQAQISDENYKLANEIFGEDLSDEIFKYESEKMILMLDKSVEKTLLDMYNENADLEEAGELAKLYINLNSVNGLPMKNAEDFKSSVEMYKTLEALKAYIKEGDPNNVLGRSLLSTRYADVDAFAEVLLRSINESNKGDIIEGLYSAIDEQLSRADGNWEFAEIPKLLDGENILARMLLDDSERNDMINKIEAHNRSRSCSVSNCTGWSKNTYCEEHKCEDDECEKIKTQNGDYCNIHTCIISGCLGYREGAEDSYCYEHECGESDCKRYANNGSYCNNHTDNSTSSGDYSPSGTYLGTCTACNGTGKGSERYTSEHYKSKEPCDVCGGSGKVEKHI